MLLKSSKRFIFCFVFCALICESFSSDDVEIEIETEQPEINFNEDELNISYEVAEKLASNPLECYNKLYPFKFNNVWKNASEIAEPKIYIPIFSGCFDWHSSVHGHWLLANLLNRFPNTELAAQITDVFNEQFTVRILKTKEGMAK